MTEEPEPMCISTTELCRRLGASFSTDFLMSLDLMPMQVTAKGVYWDENDYEEICQTLAKFFADGGAQYKQEA